MSSNVWNLPPAGLDGSYRGSCVACLEGTDTGFVLHGPAEAYFAMLLVLGVPDDQAQTILEQATGSEPGSVPGGTLTLGTRVCRPCLEASGMNIPLGVVPNLPVIEPPRPT
jgi:hypothetical protein